MQDHEDSHHDPVCSTDIFDHVLIMIHGWLHNHRHLAVLVAWGGTVLNFLLYGSVSVLGVLAFGVAEGQKDSLILDLMPVRKEVHVLISLLAVAW